MGYLAHILAAAAALVAYEYGLRLGAPSWIGAAALLVVPYALIAVERRCVLRGAFRAAAAAHALSSWWGPLGYACAACLFDWPGLVQRWTGAASTLSGWPDGPFFLTVAPFVAYALVSLDALARAGEVRGAEIARMRSFQVRLLLASLAPFALFLCITWLVGLDARVRANVEHVALWGGALTVALGALAVLTLPELLRRTWDTTPLPPGRVRQALEEFARHVRFGFRELLVWRTGHQMANAAVVGVGARQRVIVFSDLLLAQLPQRELVAVLAHEIGHAARGHVPTFIAWSTALFLAFDLSLESFAEMNELVFALGALATLALWWVGFGWLSRRSELEADLYAMQATGDVQALVSALELVGGPHARAKDTWRHFSTARRVDFLVRAAEDDELGVRLTRRMRWWSRAGCAAALAACGAQTWVLWRSYPDDRVRVELALGEYERADERASADQRVQAGTRRLAELGVMLESEQRTSAGLEEAARSALARGNAARCAGLLELLSLRGDGVADELLAALESSELDALIPELRTRRPQWAEAFEAALRTGSR